MNDRHSSKKIKVDLVFTNDFNSKIYGPVIKDSICAVIDTLTATSSIITMFGSNCSRIVLAKEKDEAFMLKKILKEYLLCGEEKGLDIEGFDYSNLPSVFSEIDLKDKKVILKTTNGTVSFFKLVSAEYVFAISLLNLEYSMKNISELAIQKNKNIFLVCSGSAGRINYEDVLTAGLAIKCLYDFIDFDLSDSARIALDVVLANDGATIEETIKKFENKEMFKALGYYNDIEFCSRLNVHELLPRLVVLKLNKSSKNQNQHNYTDIVKAFESAPEYHHLDKILLLELYLPGN